MELYNPDNFRVICILLCLYFSYIIENEKKNANENLKMLPILVRINILKAQNKRNDSLCQTWLGKFDYTYVRHKIVGTVELKCNSVFSSAENNSWLLSDSSNANIIKHLAKYKITEIPSWDSTITCKITLNDSHNMSHLFIAEDILTERHSHNIQWEKKLI